MKIKIEPFWDERTKLLVEDINDSLKRLEIDPIHTKLKDLFEILRDPDLDSKLKVSLCFVLEKIAQFEPFFHEIINSLVEILDIEQDAHVKEFLVYILGNIVLNKPNLALITRTLPLFIKYCEDSSEYVRANAEDIKNRLDVVKETKIKEREVILSLREGLSTFIEQKLTVMNEKASILSRKALSLDYESAFKEQDNMVEDIHSFSDLNNTYEDEIKAFIRKQTKENPIFEGEFQEEFSLWKESRAEKEDLIRQVHCIIRIQGKIFKIIQYIRERGEMEPITIEQIKNQTTGGVRGEWRDDEIIETLEKLVEEEIIPNLFLQQVKDLKGLMNLKKKKNED